MPIFKSHSDNQPDNTPSNGHQVMCESMADNLDLLRSTLGGSADLVTRQFRVGQDSSIQAALMFIDGLTDTDALQNNILETLMVEREAEEWAKRSTAGDDIPNVIKDRLLTAADVKVTPSVDQILTGILSGETVLLVDGFNDAFLISMKQMAERGVTEPSAQTVVRGPREAFSENIRTNTALIRRKVKDPDLWIESRTIGTRTKTSVELLYIQGLVSIPVLDELRLRLDKIDIDSILESGYIEQLIQDAPRSPFPTVYNTERPDIVAASLLEGRIAVFVDGTPFVLVLPALFTQFFQSPEDYYQRSDLGSFMRGLRFVASFISLLAPALFIAITSFHPYMLPHALLISLAAQREGVPFPVFIEALIMEFTFELLREAGIRMPRAIGPAISIVGAFVIGTAAVEAGIISAAMVIVVSVTAISNFVLPAYDLAIPFRLLRFGFMALAAAFGLYGITIGMIALVLHLCSMRSFGIPYMTPLAPFNMSGQKDTFIRQSIWKMLTRPRLVSQTDGVRQQDLKGSEPAPPVEPGKGDLL